MGARRHSWVVGRSLPSMGWRCGCSSLFVLVVCCGRSVLFVLVSWWTRCGWGSFVGGCGGGRDRLVMVVGGGGCWRRGVCVHVVIVCCAFVVSWSLWPFVAVCVCGRRCLWSLWVVVAVRSVGGRRRSSCVLMVVVRRGATTSRCQTNIVCYP